MPCHPPHFILQWNVLITVTKGTYHSVLVIRLSVIQTLDTLEIIAGLYNVVDALAFLHDKVCSSPVRLPFRSAFERLAFGTLSRERSHYSHQGDIP